MKFTILGQAASKNRRRNVTNSRTGRPMSIKSPEAMAYFHSVALQMPRGLVPFEVPVFVTIHLYYTSERPDLEESVLLDAMQSTYIGSGKTKRLVRAGAYANDKFVRRKLVEFHVDAENPRAEVTVEAL